MTARTTTSFALFQSRAFLDYFRNLGMSSNESLYAFTSNPIPIDNDPNNDVVIPDPTVIPQQAKKAVYDYAITAKKLEPNSAALCTTRIDWQVGEYYTAYNNQINVVRHDTPYYVMYETTIGGIKFINVYKCLYTPIDTETGLALPSTVPPESQDITPFTTGDGYIWKYMYSITPFQESSFLTKDFMPVPDNPTEDQLSDLIEGTQAYQLNNARINGVVGEIYSTSILDKGMNLNDGDWELEVFNGTTLSEPVENYRANAHVEYGQVQYIELLAAGSGYSGSVTVRLPDVATNDDSVLPELVANISPNLGHGTDVAQELGANYVVVNCRKYFAPDDEGAVSRNDFRTISLVRNPIDERTGGVAQADYYDMTYKMTVRTGIEGVAEDSVLEKVTAEASGQRKQALIVGVGTSAEGFQDGTLISCIPTGALYPDGSIDPSQHPVVGEYYRLKVDDGVPLRSDIIEQFQRPYIMPYSGEVLQIENRKPLNRIEGQMEVFTFIFAF